MPSSLAGRRLPKFYLVSFGIDDPGKLPVLGIVDLLENVAAFFAQDFNQGVEILHPVIDHESCSAGCKLVTLRRTNRPDGCSGNRVCPSLISPLIARKREYPSVCVAIA